MNDISWMTTMQQLRHWYDRFWARHGDPPKTLPVTIEETHELLKDGMSMACLLQPEQVNRLWDAEMQETPLAEQIRARRLDVPVAQYMAECRDDEAMLPEFIVREMYRQVRIRILRDQTQVTVRFEWDIWAPLKRLFKIKPKTRTAVIDCKVLYPFIKVQLPHNRHTLHCSVPVVA